MLEKHASIVGITGSGKTILATQLFMAQPTLSIFINTNAEVYPEQNCQIIVHDLEGFIKAWNEYGARKIVWSPTANADIQTVELEQLIRVLFQIGKAVNKEHREPQIWVHVFIDEVQEYSSKMRHSATIDGIFKRGRRFGIVGIAISQRPAEISHTILVNCSTHHIFNVSDYERQYFAEYHIPIFDNPETEAWIKNRFHYVVWDYAQFQHKTPVRM